MSLTLTFLLKHLNIPTENILKLLIFLLMFFLILKEKIVNSSQVNVRRYQI